MKKRICKGVIVSTILGVALGLVLGAVARATAAEQVIKLRYQGKWEVHEKQNWAAEQLKFAEPRSRQPRAARSSSKTSPMKSHATAKWLTPSAGVSSTWATSPSISAAS